MVKPLKMGFLQERIVPKKSVFTRDFSVFCFGIPWGRCLAPKASALPVVTKVQTALVTSLVFTKSLPLLMPRFIRHRRRFGNVPNCATPRCAIFQFLTGSYIFNSYNCPTSKLLYQTKPKMSRPKSTKHKKPCIWQILSPNISWRIKNALLWQNNNSPHSSGKKDHLAKAVQMCSINNNTPVFAKRGFEYDN